MKTKEYILIQVICQEYNLESEFMDNVCQLGLIDLLSDQEGTYIHQEDIATLEKIINLNNDLGINIEGVAVILDMMDKIDDMQNELNQLRKLLRTYGETGL